MKKDELRKYQPEDIVEIKYNRVCYLEKDTPFAYETTCIGYVKAVGDASITVTNHKPIDGELPYSRATYAIPLEDIIGMQKLPVGAASKKEADPLQKD